VPFNKTKILNKLSPHAFRSKVLARLGNQAYCKVQPSKAHGVGVFAIKDIPSGVSPWFTPNHHFFDGTVRLTSHEISKLDEPVRQMLLDYNLLSKRGLFVHPYELEVLHITQFLNASSEPNLGLDTEREDTFRTIKEIKTGEELTVDYQKDLEETEWSYNYKY
jgi:SET domain-containing protein